MTSFRNLPETVTFTVALYMPELHALASVDKKLSEVAAWATRDIIDDFLGSDFDVHCLRDFVGNEFVSKPTLDKICRRHLGVPSESIDHEVLFWVEAQLHLGLLCSRSRISLRHVLEVCFMRSSFSKYSFKGLFPPWRLSEDMHMCIRHFNPGGLALVNARNMGCPQLGRSVNEVLMSLWCLSVGFRYCRCHWEECGASFTVICFQDAEFPRCVSCGAIPMRSHQKARLPLRFQCAACRQ